jgi:hypothetical protein
MKLKGDEAMVSQELPKELYDKLMAIAAEESDKSSDDIQLAIKRTVARFKRIPNWQQALEVLLYKCAQEAVYAHRHMENIRIKKEAGEYGGPAKVTGGGMAAKVAQQCYEIVLAGRVLGDVTGEELDEMIDVEQQMVRGHTANVRLLKSLKPLVKPGQCVRNAVKPAKLLELVQKSKQ